MIRCTIGVMAYNEERNIVQVLQALLAQQLDTCEIMEIVVVASGCTDRTVELAQELARRHALIRVEAQQQRTGKAAAINHLLQVARAGVIVLVGADTLPDQLAIENLVSPFADPSVGMTGARVVPLNDPRALLGLIVHMLWRMHHRMALRWPKLGELVAFRAVVHELPTNSATDEVALEALISAQGYKLVYTPDAVVYNRGPETVDDFFLQRRRIYAGHIHIARTYGYVAASMPISHLLVLGYEFIRRRPDLLPWTLVAAVLESCARALGLMDFHRGRTHHIWRAVRSTKQVQPARAFTLLLVQYQEDSFRPARLMQTMAHIPAAEGTLLWWDYRRSQVLFMLPDHALAGAALEERIQLLTSYIVNPEESFAGGGLLSYRVMPFTPPVLALDPSKQPVSATQPQPQPLGGR